MKPEAHFKLKFDGSGGLTYNPNNSRKTFKIIFPGKYTDKIKKVELWLKDGTFLEKLYRAKPNEYGNRSRYYGKKKVAKYPKVVVVTITLVSGKVGEVTIPNTQKRKD